MRNAASGRIPKGFRPMAKRTLEQVVENIDLRLERVEQILPTLATKDELQATENNLREDLKAFATKDDLKAFATKEDLRAFATKEDLKAFATKEDLEAFATKEDLRAANEETRRHFNVVAERLEGHILLLAEGQVTLQEQMSRGFAQVASQIENLDHRVLRLEVAVRP
jgi:hypothetical protein